MAASGWLSLAIVAALVATSGAQSTKAGGASSPPKRFAAARFAALSCEAGAYTLTTSSESLSFINADELYPEFDIPNVEECQALCDQNCECTYFIYVLKIDGNNNAGTCFVVVGGKPASEIDPIKQDLVVGVRAGGHKGDPKFQGFDGSVFWFHGKKDESWCLISDKRFHINGHFIGKTVAPIAVEGGGLQAQHDLTWVQALSFLFGEHTLVVSAVQEPEWSKDLDHLKITLDDKEVVLPAFERKMLSSSQVTFDTQPKLTLLRMNKRNQMSLTVEGLFSCSLKVIPTKPTTWTEESSFAHIDANYVLHQHTSAIEGVLGRTFANVGGPAQAPYILQSSHFDKYSTSNVNTPDCKVAQFAVDNAGSVESSVTDDVQEVEKVSISCSNDGGAGAMACR